MPRYGGLREMGIEGITGICAQLLIADAADSVTLTFLE